MLKNHWNTLTICLFIETNNCLATLISENLENASNFENRELTLVPYKKV